MSDVSATPSRDATMLRATIALALHEAVAPLYFADSSDYVVGLYNVIKVLDPALWMQMEDGVTNAHYEHTLASAEAHRIAADLAEARLDLPARLPVAAWHRARIAACVPCDICRACSVALKDHYAEGIANAYRRHWFVPPSRPTGQREGP